MLFFTRSLADQSSGQRATTCQSFPVKRLADSKKWLAVQDCDKFHPGYIFVLKYYTPGWLKVLFKSFLRFK